MLHVNLPFVFTGKYWSDSHNRRNFFIEFAAQKGFDPLVAINWENIRYKEILNQVKRKKENKKRAEERKKEDRDLKSNKVGHGAFCYYKGNLRKAITDSFPEIGVLISLHLFLSLVITICFKVMAQQRQRHPRM